MAARDLPRSTSMRGCFLVVRVVLLVAAGALPATAQAPDIAGSHRVEVIDVPGDSAPYRLRVMLPPEHDTTSAGLPVLYYLDAWWWDGLLEEMVRLAAMARPARVAPIILVGISTIGNEDDWNRLRNRDFTPSPYQPIAPGVTMRTGKVILDSAGTGGASAFLRFLEERVIPAVEGRYRVASNGRGLVGHSYGGLFATWVMGTRPDLFDNFILISPSTYWNDSEVLRAGESRTPEESGAKRVFLAVGRSEMAIMRRSADALAEKLVSRDGTDLKRVEYEGADHVTVLPRALLDGLIHLYGR